MMKSTLNFFTPIFNRGFALALAVISLGALSSGCSNGLGKLRARAQVTFTTLFSSKPQLIIQNVNINDEDQSLTTPVTLSFSSDADDVTDHCNISVSPCNCSFEWEEENDSLSGNQVFIQRHALTAVATVNPGQAECALPDVWFTEIENGTAVQVSISSATPSVVFDVNTVPYTKGAQDSSGNFLDKNGNAFQNIFRYTCFDKPKFSRELASRTFEVQVTRTDDQGTEVTEDVDVPMATEFCAAGETNGVDGCPDNTATTFSTQSYYYNLYNTVNNAGSVNTSNNVYVCPSVSLRELSGTISNQFPGDIGFALASKQSPNHTVPVEAGAILGTGQTDGAESAPSKCILEDGEEPSTESSANAISTRCIGFAMKPKEDGTCPNLELPEGTTRTYRLRRYFYMYPSRFKATGDVVAAPKDVDIVYVLDRPVLPAGGAPEASYSMKGPLPCPFAFLDEKGSTLYAAGGGGPTTSPAPASINIATQYNTRGFGIPTYRATNDPAWEGKNVDGIHFPEFDSNDGEQSCSAMLPMMDYTTNTTSLVNKEIFLGTIHSSQKIGNTSNPRTLTLRKRADGSDLEIALDRLFVRPIDPFNPEYIEDTGFKACAPLPRTDGEIKTVEPPLHFAKRNDGEIAYCAEVYPTEVPNPQTIDIATPTAEPFPNGADFNSRGFVKNFTSHAVKNVPSQLACQVTHNYSVDDFGGANAFPDTNLLASQYGTQTTCTKGPTLGAAFHSGTFRVFVDFDGQGNPICNQNSCDRLVASVVPHTHKMPLLADAEGVERGLMNNDVYQCTITHDNFQGQAGERTPSTGCCAAGILHPNLNREPGPSGNIDFHRAHLEPNVACGIPTY